MGNPAARILALVDCSLDWMVSYFGSYSFATAAAAVVTAITAHMSMEHRKIGELSFEDGRHLSWCTSAHWMTSVWSRLVEFHG
jgi:hypothetical protein